MENSSTLVLWWTMAVGITFALLYTGTIFYGILYDPKKKKLSMKERLKIRLNRKYKEREIHP